MSTCILSYRSYELRNVPKVLCMNEDFVQVHTDLEKVTKLWIKTCLHILFTNKDYVHMHIELQELRIKKCPKGFMYEWGFCPCAYRFREGDEVMNYDMSQLFMCKRGLCPHAYIVSGGSDITN